MESTNSKIYFISDLHLGADHPNEASKDRELKVIQWLDDIYSSCQELYLLGDIFDYWFEYKHVIPKGYIRFLAKIAQFTDNGKKVHLFTGNHDMWIFDYLEKEIGVIVYKNPIEKTLQEKKLFLGHGDGLGPGDRGYKLIKWIFRNKVNQWLFARLHPNLGISIMRFFSARSRAYEKKDNDFKKEKEWLIQFAEEQIRNNKIDYFVFGHRHIPIDYTLSNAKSRYINLGDMITFNTYAELENGVLNLKSLQNEDPKIHTNH